MTLQELPHAVLFGDRVDDRPTAYLVHQEVVEGWQVYEAIALLEDLVFQTENGTICQLSLSLINLFEGVARLILEVALVELEESHHFAQIKLLIKIVVECRSKVVDRVAAQVYIVALAVVHEMGDTVDVISLEALQEELLEVARINRR